MNELITYVTLRSARAEKADEGRDYRHQISALQAKVDTKEEEIASLKDQLKNIQEKASLEVRAKVAEAHLDILKNMLPTSRAAAGAAGATPSPMPFQGFGGAAPQ